jgi:hypothetical protein
VVTSEAQLAQDGTTPGRNWLTLFSDVDGAARRALYYALGLEPLWEETMSKDGVET